MLASLTLNGNWKFCPAFDYLVGDQRWTDSNFDLQNAGEGRPVARTDIGWINPGFDDAGWMDHPVPMSWSAAFEDLWSYEGVGWYRREINVPAAWEGKRVTFHCEGANYFTRIYVNGNQAGEHEGGYNAFEIPVHEHLRYGETNTIAVSVDNIPKPERCPGGQYGWWNYGGLYRDVELRVSGLTWIDDVTVVTEVEPGGGTGGSDASGVKVSVDIGGDDTLAGTVLEAKMSDPSGGNVPVPMSTALVRDGKAELEFRVDKAHLWAPDTPSLYTLQLELRTSGMTEVCDRWSHRIGLRTFRIDGTRFLLNGEPVLIKGCNRHEEYPGQGRTLSDRDRTKDLDLCAWMGCNALRCHYPNHRRHYELCDERGILNYVEVPFWQWGRLLVKTESPLALDAAKSQLREIIRTLKNHPSVFMWSVSNENHTKMVSERQGTPEMVKMTADGNIELVKMAQEMDPTRPVVEASNCWPEDPVHQATDVSAVNMYVGTKTPFAKDTDAIQERMHDKLNKLREELPDRPILLSEFGTWTIRGMKTDYFPGEAFQSAKLTSMWEQTLKEENVIGAFIWVFADAEVHRRFLWAYEFNVAYGLFDHHRRPKEAAYTMRKLWNPSAAEED